MIMHAQLSRKKVVQTDRILYAPPDIALFSIYHVSKRVDDVRPPTAGALEVQAPDGKGY